MIVWSQGTSGDTGGFVALLVLPAAVAMVATLTVEESSAHFPLPSEDGEKTGTAPNSASDQPP